MAQSVCACSPPLYPPLIQWLLAPGRAGVGTEHIEPRFLLDPNLEANLPPHLPGLFMGELLSSGSSVFVFG